MITEKEFSFLANHPMFRGLPQNHLQALSELMTASAYAPQTILFRENDDAHSLFIILEGRVTFTRAAPNPYAADVFLCTLAENDCFGEFSLLGTGKRLTTAAIEKPALLISLSREDFDRFSQTYPQSAITIMRRIAQQLLEPFQKMPNAFLKGIQLLQIQDNLK